jgi:hypothetical protein
MLDQMKHLSIEEMHIQDIHSKTRTTRFATSIWRIFDSMRVELTQCHVFLVALHSD